MKQIRKNYVPPRTSVERVAMECSVCASSVKIKAEKPNVEVDEWDSFENEVTFY
jgi:hypothetical protein